MRKIVSSPAKVIYSVISLVFVLGLVLVAPLNISAGIEANSKKIIKEQFAASDAAVITTYGKGFLMKFPGLENHPPILHVQGTSYEMGYQHGYLLADEITEFSSAFCSPACFIAGGWDPYSGQSPTALQLQVGYNTLLGTTQGLFLGPIMAQAPELYEELQGMAAGLHDAGSPVSLIDLIIGSCLADLNCSSFIAWGNATTNGKLIHSVNQDYQTFDVLEKYNIVTIAKPQSGNPFLSIGSVGSFGLTGMNNAGISVGQMDSKSADSNVLLGIPQIPHFMLIRKLYQNSNHLEDVINSLKLYGGTTGWNIMTADAKVPSGVDLEVSCHHVAEVNHVADNNAIWITNHYVAYPSYQGYDGYNMVKDQMSLWGVSWAQVDTIEKWQAWLQSHQSSSWSRYEKLRELINTNYGNIDVAKATEFLSTPPISSAGTKVQLSAPVPHLFGIVRPIISQSLASVYSCVFVPEDGMAWVAVGAEPAQAGKYWPISLNEHLKLMELYTSASVGTRLGTVTFNIDDGSIQGLTNISSSDLPCTAAEYFFPYGMFAFNITNLTPGQTVTVTVKVPNPMPMSSKFFKCQNDSLIDFSHFMTQPDSNTFIFTLTDGGPGDADGTSNGIIVDPGGPAFLIDVPRSTSSSSAPTTSASPIILATIKIQNASLSACRVAPGTPVTVTANVANTSTVNGSSLIQLYVNGQEESSQGITVKSGNNMPVTFTISKDKPGTYTIYVGSVNAGSFIVDELADPNIILYISIASIFIALVGGAVFIMRRRQSAH